MRESRNQRDILTSEMMERFATCQIYLTYMEERETLFLQFNTNVYKLIKFLGTSSFM